MALDEPKSNPGTSFLISAGIIYEIVAAINSSPQTTEINAAARAPTLMKWVKLGLLQAGGFTLLGMLFAKGAGYESWPIALGWLTAGTLIWVQYVHAKEAGLANPGPPTERYS